MSTDIRIAIIQGGWVLVGYYSRNQDGVKISKSKSIRIWGTTKGLGQLRNGPIPETKLDEIGEFDCHPLQVIGTISDLNQEKWISVLNQ